MWRNGVEIMLKIKVKQKREWRVSVALMVLWLIEHTMRSRGYENFFSLD